MSHLAAYKIIQTDILGKIASGEFRPGTQLPTEADFMKQYNVSRITVQRALNELKQQGVLLRKPRAGTFVREEAVSGTPAAAFTVPTTFTKTGRVNLGIVAPFDMSASGTYQYLNGVMKSLMPSRDNVTLHNTCNSVISERSMLENCLKDGCSGILYYPGVGSAPPLDLLIQMEKMNYPCVLLDKELPGVNLPCVQADNYTAAYEITKLLLNKGHRNIVYFLGRFATTVYQRYAGFCAAMQESGIGHLGHMSYSEEEMYRKGHSYRDMIEQMLKSGVTAVFCTADDQAKALMDACVNMGVDIPGKLAIAGFDGTYPGVITSVLQPYVEIGNAAADILMKWILTGEVERATKGLPATLLEGRST